MLIAAAATGLLLGVLFGGSLSNLLSVRWRFAILVLVALLLRASGVWLIEAGVVAPGALFPIIVTSFTFLLVGLWLNRAESGMPVIMAGAFLNGAAMGLNDGRMPVYQPALDVAGVPASSTSPLTTVPLPDSLTLEFLLQGGPLGDVLPVPLPLLPSVASLGDVLIAVGMAWFLFAAVVRGTPNVRSGIVSLWGKRPESDYEDVRVGLDRPIVLGGGMGPGLSTSTSAAGASTSSAIAGGVVGAEVRLPSATPTLRGRLLAHPYVRLMRDPRFSAFWLAGTISLFGDRLHQIALGVMVLAVTNSAVQTALIFLAATLPNLVLGPLAGTLVDRWDQKRVMIASDLIRAAIVLSIPFVVESSIALVYPLVFMTTTVSLFFRPARAAVLPRIVRRADLTPANASVWTGETLADIAGYPLAGVLVAFLGANVALAFWLDAVTYLISAFLLLGLTIPPVASAAGVAAAGAVRLFIAELRAGWRFLRSEPTLFQNTLVSVVAQFSVGALIALAVVYADRSLSGDMIPFPESYAALEAAIGLGNLVGGVVVGAIGTRLRKGWMVVGGFALTGLSMVVLGLTSNEAVAIAAALVGGVFNLVYIIPSQTLFGERTPPGMMGRVVAIRTSLVMGALTGAMAVSAMFADTVDAGMIIAASGVLTVMAAGIAAMLPAVRDS